MANGTTYVADAGANAVFAITPTGECPRSGPQAGEGPDHRERRSKANGLPDCTVGKKYEFEAVPPMSRWGPTASLYVTSLPGGPEDGAPRRHGRVIRINPVTGKTRKVAGGLASPPAWRSRPTVTSMSRAVRGVIARIRAGTAKVRTYTGLPMPAAVETTPTGLLATLTALPGGNPRGKVVPITP